MSNPPVVPFAVTASYMKRQYDANFGINDPYGASSTADTTRGAGVFNALVTPPATGVSAATAAEQVAYNAGFVESSFTAQTQVETLTISATGGKFKLAFGGEATTALNWNSSAATIQSALAALTTVPSAVAATPVGQTITFSAAAASGTWVATFGGQSTAALQYNISTAALQTALEGLSTIGANGIASVTGTPGTSYVVTFGGDLALTSEELGTSNVTLQTAGSVAVTVAVTVSTAGVATPALVVAGTAATSTTVGTYTITYGNALASNFIEPSWEPATVVDAGQLTPKATAYGKVVVTTQGRTAFSVWPVTHKDEQYDLLRNEWDYGSGNNFSYSPES